MSCNARRLMAGAALLFTLSLTMAQRGQAGQLTRGDRTVGPIDWTPLLPPGPGREEVMALCSGCHTPGVLILQRRTPKMWHDFLLGMNAARTTGGELCACIGGPLDDTEIALFTSYLSHAFSRDNPIDQLPLNVNTAAPGALARLPGLSGSDVQKLVDHRAHTLFASKQDIGRVLGAAKFRRVLDFIDVKDSLFRADGLLPM